MFVGLFFFNISCTSVYNFHDDPAFPTICIGLVMHWDTINISDWIDERMIHSWNWNSLLIFYSIFFILSRLQALEINVTNSICRLPYYHLFCLLSICFHNHCFSLAKIIFQGLSEKNATQEKYSKLCKHSFLSFKKLFSAYLKILFLVLIYA